jgi:Secretion system C-terminal sorting domain
MKTIFTFVLLAVFAASYAQSNVAEPVKTGSQSCEDLVFNTRELTQFAYNTRCKTEAYPFLSESGNDLYFTNNQSYDWLFYAHKDTLSGVWSVPVPVVLANFTKSIRSSYLSPDFKTLYFTEGNFKGGVYKSEALEGSRTSFSQPEKIEILNASEFKDEEIMPFSCLSFADNMQQMYAYCGYNYGEEELNTMALYQKTGDNAYRFVRFVSGTPKEIGTLSSDGLTYFFTNEENKHTLYCKKRKALSDDFGPEVYIVRVFESHLEMTQIRVSASAQTMVMVVSEGIWNKNDIFFYDFKGDQAALSYALHNANADNRSVRPDAPMLPVLVPEKDAPASLRKTEVVSQTGSDLARIEIGNPFPNPAKQQFYIYYNVSGENPLAPPPVIVLLDQAGRIVHTQKLDYLRGEAEVRPEDLASGVYYVRIDYNGLSSAVSKITLSF